MRLGQRLPRSADMAVRARPELAPLVPVGLDEALAASTPHRVLRPDSLLYSSHRTPPRTRRDRRGFSASAGPGPCPCQAGSSRRGNTLSTATLRYRFSNSPTKQPGPSQRTSQRHTWHSIAALSLPSHTSKDSKAQLTFRIAETHVKPREKRKGQKKKERLRVSHSALRVVKSQNTVFDV